MSLLLAAMVLPLYAVQVDDPKLQSKRTFVSQSARAYLTEGNSEEVLCLNRKGNPKKKTICLVKSEWKQAVKLAKTQPKEGAQPFIPFDHINPPLSQSIPTRGGSFPDSNY